MTCLEFRLRLDQYLDQELSAEDKHSAEDHLESCSSCREEFASHRQVQQLLSGFTPPVQPPEDYWDRSRDRVLARTVLSSDYASPEKIDTFGGHRSYTPLVRSMISVAASVALLATALVLGSRHERPAVILRLGQSEVIVSAGLADMLDTPDGGPLTLGDQRRIGSLSVLVGGPGMVGRFGYLPGLLRIY
jgi:hypothetical protein